MSPADSRVAEAFRMELLGCTQSQSPQDYAGLFTPNRSNEQDLNKLGFPDVSLGLATPGTMRAAEKFSGQQSDSGDQSVACCSDNRYKLPEDMRPSDRRKVEHELDLFQTELKKMGIDSQKLSQISNIYQNVLKQCGVTDVAQLEDVSTASKVGKAFKEAMKESGMDLDKLNLLSQHHLRALINAGVDMTPSSSAMAFAGDASQVAGLGYFLKSLGWCALIGAGVLVTLGAAPAVCGWVALGGFISLLVGSGIDKK